MKGWHFVNQDGCLGYGDGRRVEPGQTLQQPDMSREPVLCRYGMHASRLVMDALEFAPGPILCRIEIPNPVVGDDKLVGRERTCLWMIDATLILHEFACRCAEWALDLVGNPDPRSLAAIETKRLWLAGEASDADLDAACDAARAAARAAAWAAAREAAWDAAWDARDVARARQNRQLTSMLIAEAKRQGVYQ